MDEQKYHMESSLYNSIMVVKHEIQEACEYAKEGDDKMAYKELIDAHEMIKNLLQKSPHSAEQVMNYYEKMRLDPDSIVNRRGRRGGYRQEAMDWFGFGGGFHPYYFPMLRHRGRDGRWVANEQDYAMPPMYDGYPMNEEYNRGSRQEYDEMDVYDRRGGGRGRR